MNETKNPSAPVGILLANTGSPDAPEFWAVRRYLAQFLSDRRVIELPRGLWLPLLHGIILNLRPARSARLYRRVWTSRGSPLVSATLELARLLQAHLSSRLPVRVEAGMRYGSPSIASALRALRDSGVQRLVILPLFPQYSGTTSGTIFDAVFQEIGAWRRVPALTTISDYHDQPAYLQAVSAQIEAYWGQSNRPQKLLFSFHGIPKSYATRGDPYLDQCHQTARRLAERLNFTEAEWMVAFQSRFGPQEWLKPYTDETLRDLGRAKISSLSVVCPGFAVDCLETIDEIGHEGRRIFLDAGGGNFNAIPALNADPVHVQALGEIVCGALPGCLQSAGGDQVTSL